MLSPSQKTRVAWNGKTVQATRVRGFGCQVISAIVVPIDAVHVTLVQELAVHGKARRQ